AEVRALGRRGPTGKSKAAVRAAAARQKAKERAAAAARDRALRVALGYLDEAARLGEQHAEARPIAVKALRARFAEHASRENVDSALADLRRLHARAPGDDTRPALPWERRWARARHRAAS